MGYHPLGRGLLHSFSSIDRGFLLLLLKPLNAQVMSGNQTPLTGYLVHHRGTRVLTTLLKYTSLVILSLFLAIHLK
jgi:hypothetical protein